MGRASGYKGFELRSEAYFALKPAVGISSKSMFENRNSVIPSLRAPTLEGVSVNAGARRGFDRREKTLQFLLPRGSGYFGWWGSIKALCTSGKVSSARNASYLHTSNVARFHLPGGSLSASFALHCSVILLLIYLPQAIPTKAMAFNSAPTRTERIYYRVPLLDTTRTLPRIAPAGPGARPGTGSKPNQLPALGSTAAHPKITVVSKPARPDNFRQTIYQRSSPPDLRITTELKLPNMVLGNPLEPPKPNVKFDPNNARPTQSNRQFAPEAAPAVALENPQTPLMSYLDPSTSQPRLAIPLAGAARPTIKSGNGGATSSAGGGVAAPGDGNDLLVIGVDPAGAGSVVDLPPGNRWGEFSISPAGGQPGSPGGVPGGVVGGGSGGSGAGGDGSTGVGPGGGGGGGGNSGASGALSISGTGGGEASGALGSALVASMVYPVPVAALPKLRKNALVVSAGPIGGGGTAVYHALSCGKIYTIFLPMPGANWTMQYCEKGARSKGTTTDSRATVIHLEQALLPPDLDPDSRFDFRRLPVPPGKALKMIVLKGSLQEDGTIEGLQIYQSLVPQMDEAARVAFSHWKFKPALRGGKPVAVDILVGIPGELPGHPQAP